eukprot:Cvel_20512.t1-p1 / transcript=Cvel_20512.t1 / gene=Cvel_20512 / organism=Chromera_velia_CCMP2878 / gene_product=ATP-dependent RNA helicase DBP2, putative / transcript_product=ATP-dependent RNA helicase DBP2, putative / location=Cvel_scaffold1846:30445-38247(+) / protein_length=451 / sequence_SO=supercontig / SO=protein_coding / is_pseudo=false
MRAWEHDAVELRNTNAWGGASYESGMRGQQGAFRDDQCFENLRAPDWSREVLEKVNKNFYKEHEEVSGMTRSVAEEIRRANKITIVKGRDVPNPIPEFRLVNFPEYLNARIRAAGFVRPSPIQMQGWPVALRGHDLIGIAETGSGKTCAFLLPGFVHIRSQPNLKPGDGPVMLVMAPTRELAQQIQEESKKFGDLCGIRTAAVYGGAPRGPQVSELRRGAHVAVATPGRLLDFLQSGTTNLKRVTFLVLDEADRMLDMGFEPQIRKVVQMIRKDRQTLLWSATWPREVQALARDLCREDPVHINIGDIDLRAAHTISQFVKVVDAPHQKPQELCGLLKKIGSMDERPKVLIFVETKRLCDDIVHGLKTENFKALAIHGDKEQRERDFVIRSFKSGQCPIMVATDVCARGLDVKDIGHVINWSVPNNIEDYVHRIGRTGRAGSTGRAWTFVD